MRNTPYTQDEVRNARFLRAWLARFPDAKAASQAACHYATMAEYGRGWWFFVAAQCAARYVRQLRHDHSYRDVRAG